MLTKMHIYHILRVASRKLQGFAAPEAAEARGMIQAVVAALAPKPGVEEQTYKEGLTGPVSEREEVTGIGTRSSKSHGNTGFAGGCTGRLVAA